MSQSQTTLHTLYSSRTADKFVVRLPDGMRERIADVARDNHRSMNSEIISRLEASLVAGDQVVAGPDVETDAVMSTESQIAAEIINALAHKNRIAEKLFRAMPAAGDEVSMRAWRSSLEQLFAPSVESVLAVGTAVRR